MVNNKALLFGLNYSKHDDAKLRGCINDVRNVGKMLESWDFTDVKIHTDEDHNPVTTSTGIVQEINNLAIECCKSPIDLVWIHFSGHGTRKRDWSNDETDGYDECIVPSNYKTGGLISDDIIKSCLRNFPERTKVIAIFDCCHSGTIGDLKYLYKPEQDMVMVNQHPPCDARVIMISGCQDTQTSADAYNVNNKRKFSGAMTSCLLKVMDGKQLKDVVICNLMKDLRTELKTKHFTQIPQLTSSVLITSDATMI